EGRRVGEHRPEPGGPGVEGVLLGPCSVVARLPTVLISAAPILHRHVLTVVCHLRNVRHTRYTGVRLWGLFANGDCRLHLGAAFLCPHKAPPPAAVSSSSAATASAVSSDTRRRARADFNASRWKYALRRYSARTGS